MGAEVLLGLKSTEISLTDSFEYFFKRKEWILGGVLLLFTFILPILKFGFLGTRLLNIQLSRGPVAEHILSIINKWAMLDVYIVALLIMTFKFESTIIDNYVMIGTGYFAMSILLMMVCSYFLKTLSDRQNVKVRQAAANKQM
jgi:paraquat-inducible protein A